MPTHRTVTDASSPPMTSTTRPLSKPWAIGAITVGSGLELYDSVVYNFFATLIGPQYFPLTDPLGQLLFSFAAFGVGYVMRPIGGLVIGAYADRVGRKPAVVLTLWLMALSAALLVLTPTYAQIGLAAPILMTIARLLQGFAIGGETRNRAGSIQAGSHSARASPPYSRRLSPFA
jgi:MFS family permease